MSAREATSTLSHASRAPVYRVLCSARKLGPVRLSIAGGDAHPGAAAFLDLLASVEARLVSQGKPGESAGLVGVELWAFLHGVVDLRITKPEMNLATPDNSSTRCLAISALRPPVLPGRQSAANSVGCGSPKPEPAVAIEEQWPPVEPGA